MIWERLQSSLSRFRREDQGATAIEFAIVGPLFLSLLFSAIEMGWVMTQSMMLESAVNRTARSMQISPTSVSAAQFKKDVCAQALILRDCENNLSVELTPIDKKTDIPTDATPCVDRAEKAVPLTEFKPGKGNEILFGRACVVVDALTPGIGVALSLPVDASGGLRLTARFAFVSEAI